MTAENGSRLKWLVGLIPFIAGIIFMFATINADVRHLQETVVTKENVDVAQVNQQAILRELGQIEAQLAEIKAQHDRLMARLSR